MSSTPHIGPWRTPSQGHLTPDANGDPQTDYARWRLVDEEGRQTWRYLESDEENQKWPQSIADKYHLGLPTVFDAQLAQCDLELTSNDAIGSSRTPRGQDAVRSCREWTIVLLTSTTRAW